MQSYSSPPRSKRGPALASNFGRKAAAVSSVSQQLADARRPGSPRPPTAPADIRARSRHMAAPHPKLSASSAKNQSGGSRGMREPFVGPSDAQFKVPQKRPSASNLGLNGADSSVAPPAIRPRGNNRFDGGRNVNGHVSESYDERSTPIVQPSAISAGLSRATSTGVRVSLISVNSDQTSAGAGSGDIGSRPDTIAIEEVVEVLPALHKSRLRRRSSSPPDFGGSEREEDGNDPQDSFVDSVHDNGSHSRFFQRKGTVESTHGMVEEVEDDERSDNDAEDAEQRRATPPMPRNALGYAIRPDPPDRPRPVRVSGRPLQVPSPNDVGSGDDIEAQRARYLDQIADAVLEGGRAEIICEEVKRWSNVAYDNDEAWKAGGEEFARHFGSLNQSVLDYADGAARNFGTLLSGIQRYEAELERTGNKIDDYRQGLARWGTDIVSGTGPPADT